MLGGHAGYGYRYHHYSWAIMRSCLRDPKFSHFDTIPVCVRQIHRRTHVDSIYRASIATRGKNVLPFDFASSYLCYKVDGAISSESFLSSFRSPFTGRVAV